MKTYNAKPGEIAREWYFVDAEGKTLGRLASHVAMALRGKLKPIYTPHMDTGDFVIVINAEKVRLSGNKPEQKKYFHHTMYPGGSRWTKLTQVLAKHPERVIEKAVKGMVPRNRLGRAMVKKLKRIGTGFQDQFEFVFTLHRTGDPLRSNAAYSKAKARKIIDPGDE